MLRRICIRQEQPASHPDGTQFTLQLSPHLFAFRRQSMDRRQSIFRIFNLSDRKRTLKQSDLSLICTDIHRVRIHAPLGLLKSADSSVRPVGCAQRRARARSRPSPFRRRDTMQSSATRESDLRHTLTCTGVRCRHELESFINCIGVVLVAVQFLHAANVLPTLQQPGRKGMTKRVGSGMLGQSRLPQSQLHGSPKRGSMQVMTAVRSAARISRRLRRRKEILPLPSVGRLWILAGQGIREFDTSVAGLHRRLVLLLDAGQVLLQGLNQRSR